METVEIRPQPGPQTAFLSTPADIAFYGGGAGGGKSFALLLEPLRHVHIPEFGGVIFRREGTQILNQGGLWDESSNLYPHVNGTPQQSRIAWTFPSGARIRFAHLEHEKSKHAWQGAQVPYIGFDEGTHFTEGQFFYMLSRNRSTCGVRPYVRLTYNPDPDSFVTNLVEWYIDEATGYAIPERSGVLRYFIRRRDELIWADSPAELVEQFGPETASEVKSFTFISASVFDNPALLSKDPGYLANLKALPTVEMERLLRGNHKVRPAAGLYFQRSWFEVVDAAPAGVKTIRHWDLAATDPRPGTDPDWTVGLKMTKTENGLYYVEDVVRLRGNPNAVEQAIANTAAQDGRSVEVSIVKDPGQAGKSQIVYYTKVLVGYAVTEYPTSKDKVTMAAAVSSQAKAGNVKLVRGRWNSDFLNVLENFPSSAHDDDVDALSGAFNKIIAARRIMLV